MSDIVTLIKKETSNMDSTLDLGCGTGRWIKFVNIKNYLGVDAYGSYMKMLKLTHNVIIHDIRDLSLFSDKSFDCVMAIDVIEHLEKEDAFKLIREMERIARKKIIIHVPDGFVYQDPNDKRVLDDMGPSIYQEHLCGFSLKELEDLGFKLIERRPGDKVHNRDYFALFVTKELTWKI